MSCARRAKIFSPFDALKGFNEAISSKEVPYVERIALEQQDREELDRRLNILRNLTFNRRMAKANRVVVTVRFYVPCEDKNNLAYGLRGLYEIATDVCWGVDPDVSRTIRVGTNTIAFDSIFAITSSDGLFENNGEAWLAKQSEASCR